MFNVEKAAALTRMKSIEPIAGPIHGYLTALRLFRGKRGNRGSRLHVLPIQEGVLWASLAAPSAQRGIDCLFYALSQP